MHHAFADTEDDPHSPKYDETIWNMMWKTKTIYSDIANKKLIPEKRFTEGVPQWEAFDKFARSWPSRLFWAACYITMLCSVCQRMVVMAVVADPVSDEPDSWRDNKLVCT